MRKKKLTDLVFRAKTSFTKEEFAGGKSNVGIEYAGFNIFGRAGIAVSLSEKKAMAESFGFFGGNDNMNTFFPNLDVQSDVIPKPEDFIDVKFRLLSATTVGAGSWKATDFSNATILKNSMPKLVNTPVYPNHEQELSNWLGYTKAVLWSEPKLMEDGTTIPAGIDGILSIDAKSNPKIARGILMGAIYSNSVTVEFDWKPSHNFSNMEEFNRQVGTMVDNKMVRRVATIIYNYHETSLVWLGADPYAKLYDQNGNLQRIDETGVYYQNSKEDERKNYEKENKYSVGIGFSKEMLLSLRQEKENFKQSNNSFMNPKILALLLSMFSLTKAEDLTEDMAKRLMLADSETQKLLEGKATNFDVVYAEALNFAKKADASKTEVDMVAFMKDHAFIDKATLTSYEGKVAEYDNLKAEAGKVASLQADITKLTNEKTALEADAKLGKEYLSMKRNETIRLYKLTAGDKASEAVVTLMKDANDEALTGLLAAHVETATHKFSGSCKKCGSGEFQFRSSLTSGKGDEAFGASNNELSFEDIYKKYSQTSMNPLKSQTEQEEKK